MSITTSIQTCYTVQSQKPKQEFAQRSKHVILLVDRRHCDTFSQYSKIKPLQVPFAIINPKLLHCKTPSQCSKTKPLQDPLAIQQKTHCRTPWQCSKTIATPFRNAAKPLRHLFAMLQNNCGHHCQWKKSKFLRCLAHLAQTIAGSPHNAAKPLQDLFCNGAKQLQ